MEKIGFQSERGIVSVLSLRLIDGSRDYDVLVFTGIYNVFA